MASSPLVSLVDPKEQCFDLKRNFGEYMLKHLRIHANSKWINGTTHESVAYGELAEQVEAVWTALCRLGLQAGDRIMLLSTSRLQLLPMFLGAARANIASMYMSPGFGLDDVVLATTSLGHVYALFDVVCKAIVQGASAAFVETADDVLEALHTHKVTALSTTSYTARCILENEKRKNYDLGCLKHVTSATASINEDVAKALFQELNLKSFTQLRTKNPAVLGLVAIQLRDVETRKPLGPWEQGELVVRSPGLMLGYWGRLHEPATDSQGWYRTGDQCYYDEDGWLYLVQRMSDFFCCRGAKVSPVLVEVCCTNVRKCTTAPSSGFLTTRPATWHTPWLCESQKQAHWELDTSHDS
ncbi:hypothetical protein HPB52_014556 [Rhipicephalus sanguineus]|uniref:AMP-dependent synthetase/ligase domain-containing protein n=1 Tax=Rhipicephalus sanguineus TaxID=34632 RepID=A0A9D4Q1C3_RHISA|nr:hypothetical protein HPB52_014556 [Rhipicephalus sanguineus]